MLRESCTLVTSLALVPNLHHPIRYILKTISPKVL
jgi:hypothetical protein